MRPRFIKKGTRTQDDIYNIPMKRQTRGSVTLSAYMMGNAQHGTRHGYYKGCRCEACCDVQQAYHRERYQLKKQAKGYKHA